MSLIGGHKPQEACSESIADHFASAAELEAALQSLQPGGHSFAKCFEDKQYSGIAEGLKKSAIAELFLMNLRLRSGVEQTRETVKEIDGMMGRTADALSCVDSSQLRTLSKDTAQAAKLISQKQKKPVKPKRPYFLPIPGSSPKRFVLCSIRGTRARSSCARRLKPS
jgi:hypothetical protein